MGAKEEIRKIIREVDKTLSPKDRVRWKFGYRDGLSDALKIMEKNHE